MTGGEEQPYEDNKFPAVSLIFEKKQNKPNLFKSFLRSSVLLYLFFSQVPLNTQKL